MSKEELKPVLLSVKEIFSGKESAATEKQSVYEIPVYQRNYAWGREQIEQLIEDIISANPKHDDPYFLGNLIVSAPKNEKMSNGSYVYEVVDGQQRLTTLYMILHYLSEIKIADLIKDVTFKDKLRFQARPGSSATLKNLGIISAGENSLTTGYKIIAEMLGKHSEIDVFAKNLLDGTQLIRVQLPEDTDLNRYFEIMNTRGQQLQPVDIVKARLMKEIEEDSRYAFARIWDACAKMDQYIQMTLAPKDTDLRSKIFGDNWDALKCADLTKLSNHFKEVDERSKQPGSTSINHNFADRSIKDAIEVYLEIPETEPEEDPESNSYETPFKFESLLLHALRVMDITDHEQTDSSLDDSRLISIFEKEITDGSQAKRFIETLLVCKFKLDNYMIKRNITASHSEDGEWSLHCLRRKVNKPNYLNTFSGKDTPGSDAEIPTGKTRDILLLQSMLRVTYTSAKTMHWVTEILRLDLTSDITNSETVKRTLQNYARKKVKDAYFAREHTPTGFEIERIVFTYLDYLLALKEKDSVFKFAFRNSIEHFYPQHLADDQRRDEMPVISHDYLHDFGNLALVTVSANSKFSNNSPVNKKQFEQIIKQSKKLGFMAAAVVDHKSWSDTAIGNHRDQMKEILEDDIAKLPIEYQ